MSEKIIETKVDLAGTRESIIRILNQAFRMCSNKEFRIADGDSPFKERVLWYIDVEESDGSENYDANPAGVTAEGEEYTLTIVSRVREGQHTYYPEDWHYWCGMMSVYYDCLIKFKKD